MCALSAVEADDFMSRAGRRGLRRYVVDSLATGSSPPSRLGYTFSPTPSTFPVAGCRAKRGMTGLCGSSVGSGLATFEAQRRYADRVPTRSRRPRKLWATMRDFPHEPVGAATWKLLAHARQEMGGLVGG